ncbi:MAG: signal recognition particle protein [Alphaproteobacteria bacterium]|nr:signal recognition particle protein [Alphaproteobacteria bacterium]MBU0858433.1 signal recognition particle protein [Alphaproteobacteria bacterium]
MFQSLSDRLGTVFTKMRGKGVLKESDIDEAMREIRVALLEADVALPVVKSFIEKVKSDAIGQEVIKGINPAQQVVKIVNDAMIEMLGSETQELKFSSPPSAYLMVGLQGSGKTTSTAKIAKFLTDKHRMKVLMASLDVARPAAQEQLRQLGEQTGVATLPIVAGQKPVDIAKRAMDTARKEGFDVVMLDTAGRLSIDDELMAEAKAVRDATNPIEVLLVADAMTGQDAVNTAKKFDEIVGITGVMLTRVDGDARGGAAMSMKAVTGKPVKLLGVGEKWSALESFHPDRMAGRILGMGDVVSLVEKAVETIDRDEAEKMAAKFKKGQFDFTDMLSQMQQIQKMGGAGGLMKMLPGMSGMAAQLEEKGMDDKVLKRQEAIILSMTPQERAKPELLNAKRKIRIAAGSGTTVQDINKSIKQLQQMQTMMKRMRKMGMGKMMGMMKGMMGPQDAAMLDGMDPDLMADIPSALGNLGSTKKFNPNDLLGANPFLKGKK